MCLTDAVSFSAQLCFYFACHVIHFFVSYILQNVFFKSEREREREIKNKFTIQPDTVRENKIYIRKIKGITSKNTFHRDIKVTFVFLVTQNIKRMLNVRYYYVTKRDRVYWFLGLTKSSMRSVFVNVV